jgi:hypothetical protein
MGIGTASSEGLNLDNDIHKICLLTSSSKRLLNLTCVKRRVCIRLLFSADDDEQTG